MMDSWFPWIQQLSSKEQTSEHVSTVTTMLSHALQDCRLLTCEILGSQLKLWKSGTRWSFWFIFHHFRIQCIFVFCIVFCTLVCLCPWSQLNYSFDLRFPLLLSPLSFDESNSMDADFFHRSLAAQDTIDALKAYLQNICHFSGCGNEPWWMLRLSSLMHPTGERCSLPEATPRSREGGEANLGVWKASTKYQYIHFSDFSVFVFCW